MKAPPFVLCDVIAIRMGYHRPHQPGLKPGLDANFHQSMLLRMS